MRGWEIQTHGKILFREDLPKPVPKPGEGLVRMSAVGINHLDNWVYKGVQGHRFPLPIIPGSDGVGILEEIIPSPDSPTHPRLLQGSRVLISPGLSCGKCSACLSDQDPFCSKYGILGESQNGCCAEWVAVPLDRLIPLKGPEFLSDEGAACLAIPFLTAWTMLVRKAQIKAGDLVLIQAGGSGVSVAAIQIAKFFGAKVATTVRTAEKAAKATLLGADEVIETSSLTEGLRKPLKEAATRFGRKGFDIVMDHVGAATLQDSLRILVPGGKLVTCGATSGAEVTLDLKLIFFKSLSILGSTMGSHADLIQIVNLVENGQLKPIVDSVYPFLDFSKILERLESRQVFGKLVLSVRA